ncbi:hypothetical protein PAXINDRAFT_17886 [Paxillus involutus ATCC 200175]|uniref:Uncharacterized protein n=1 Tax=Paxillus involutus ATCC 200175 TaxID=664439 RepID=A0A0C9TML6_PAXIN|nr:hypothetical protein PAXINDRAFT_17886 [Paxillus involutus ATCC 200175]
MSSSNSAVAFLLPVKRFSYRASVKTGSEAAAVVDSFSNVILSVAQGTEIVDLLNALFREPHSCVSQTMHQQLCRMITPGSDVFLDDVTCAQAQSRPRHGAAILTWRELPTTSPFRKTTAFTISFFLRTSPPFSAVDLTSLLFYFINTYGSNHLPDGPRGGPIQHFGFALRPDGICGILLCGPALRLAFLSVCANAQREPESYTVSGWPVTMWPASAQYARHPYQVHLAFRVAKRLRVLF